MALTVPAVVQWSSAGDPATTLFTGNPAEVLIGLVLVGAITASLVISLLGLVVGLLPGSSADHATTASTPTP